MADLSLAESLRLFRKRTGLNYSDFCLRYGLPRTTYTHWENGLKPPSKVAELFLRCMVKYPEVMQFIVSNIKKEQENEVCS